MDFNYLKVPGKNPTKVYLAVPYSHPNPLWMRLRFELANLAAMQLIEAGFVVFSPISHSHPISNSHTDPALIQNYAVWLGQDEHFMEWADVLVVLELPGWAESKGVNLERMWFNDHNKPTSYLGLNSVYYSEMSRIEEVFRAKRAATGS